MKYLPLIAALMTSPAMAADTTVSPDKVLVLACLENMGTSTQWSQCVELMFQPCVANEVGSDAHAACLGEERKIWADTVRILQTDLQAAITTEASSQVVDIMGQWTGYVVQKCEEQAAARTTGAESARLGCEISELAGLSGEFAACIEGRSTAQYCVYKEE